MSIGINDVSDLEEPVIVFPISNTHLGDLISNYYTLCQRDGASPECLRSIIDVRADVLRWQSENREKLSDSESGQDGFGSDSESKEASQSSGMNVDAKQEVLDRLIVWKFATGIVEDLLKQHELTSYRDGAPFAHQSTYTPLEQHISAIERCADWLLGGDA